MAHNDAQLSHGDEYIVFYTGGPYDGRSDRRISTDGSWDIELTVLVALDGVASWPEGSARARWLLGVAAQYLGRNLTPEGRAGEVQGLRMVAVVLIPMVVGPFIGAAVIRGANETYVDLGVTRQVPTPWIFVAAAVVAVFIVIPVRLLRRRQEA